MLTEVPCPLGAKLYSAPVSRLFGDRVLRRERNVGAPQGRDNAEMELGWDRVGLCLGPMLAYVGPSWPMSGPVWTYVGSESLPIAIPHLVLAPGGRHHHYHNRSRAGVAKGGGLSFGSPGPLG